MKLQTVGLLIAASALMMTACGQKGPLYMPKGQAPAEQAAPAEADGAAEQQEDSSKEKDSTGDAGK